MSDNKIFVGIKINERLNEQLDSSNASVKKFFDGTDPEYLQVMQIDYDEYIGKMANSGASMEVVGNMFMNVKTMLRMICPKFSFPDNDIKIFALGRTADRNYY